MNAWPRVLDASAIVAMFQGHWRLEDLVKAAERGQAALILPTTAIAEAEADVAAGTSGWEGVLLSEGVRSLSLTEHTAIEIGQWPGELSTRQAVHEARALRAAVVTAEPGRYRGLPVTLNVI
jgi:hypothetical protein